MSGAATEKHACLDSLVIISTRACFVLYQTLTTEVLSSPVADVDVEVLLTTLGELLSGWTQGEDYVIPHLTHVEDTRHLNLYQFVWVKLRHTFLQGMERNLNWHVPVIKENIIV